MYQFFIIKLEEYLDSETSAAKDFIRRSLSVAPFSGSWPFSCERIIPCPDIPHQTCGCKNLLGTEDLAIVYNLKSDGKINFCILQSDKCQHWLELLAIKCDHISMTHYLQSTISQITVNCFHLANIITQVQPKVSPLSGQRKPLMKKSMKKFGS